MEKKTIINCHTHIFIGKNIPPFIGKTFMPWILYRLLTIPFIIGLCKFWYTSKYSPYKLKFSSNNTKLKKLNIKIKQLWQKNFLLRTLVDTIGFTLVIFTAYILFKYFFKKIEIAENLLVKLYSIENFGFLKNDIIQIAIIIFTIIAIPYGRKIAILIAKNSKKISLLFINQDQLKYISRYVSIGRFAYYDSQSHIFKRLKNQYPEKTEFIVLPMDMEFMDAGDLKPEGSYEKQMIDLKSLKQTNPQIHPFIFVDPRREKVGQNDFFKWHVGLNNEVELDECFIKEYIVENQFSGLKIYPALGYFPFDKKLLPLWKYAADNEIPIMTHCIRGTIYFRGLKKEEWYYHPIFKESNTIDYMFLGNQKNIEYSLDFTHPLNYLCLLEPLLLTELVKKSKNEDIKKLFGYNEETATISSDLRNLKICFGHYGGDDEWKKFLERDRDNYSHRVIAPAEGINFIKNNNLKESYGTLVDVWKNADWYTIISSMIIQYPNVYADLSYIIHNQEIIPMLKQTLANGKLREKVLFGTDFYVVRNHNSEKELLANTLANLSQNEFDQIARSNPVKYLKKK